MMENENYNNEENRNEKMNEVIDNQVNNVEKQNYNNLNNKSDDSNTSIKVFIALLIIIGLGVAAVIFFNKNGNTKQDEKKDNNSISNEEQNGNNKKEQVSNLGYSCKKSNCSMNSISGDIFLIVDGTDKILYDNLNGKVLNTFDEKYNTEKLGNGLVVSDENEKKAYYDVNLNKYVTEFKYENFEKLSDKYIIAYIFPYGDVTDGEYWYDKSANETNSESIMNDFEIDVISINDGNTIYHKEIHDWKNKDGMKPISISKISDADGENNYYLEKNSGHFEILDLDFKLVLSIDMDKADYYSNASIPQILSNGTIFMKFKNYFAMYDLSGNEVYKSREYEQLVKIENYDGYFVVVENRKVKVIDLTEKAIVEFTDWKSNYEVVNSFNFNDKMTLSDKEKTDCVISDDGIYIKAIDKKNNNSKVYLYYFNPENNQKKSYEAENQCIDKQI